MLETDDIQHFLLERTPARAGRYELLSFEHAAAGRAWLSGMMGDVASGAGVRSDPAGGPWVTIAFTWNGLAALGVDAASLGTFPEEFRAGMAARAAIFGATGHNAPDRWVGRIGDPALHARSSCSSRATPRSASAAARPPARQRSMTPGIDVLSALDLDAIAPEPRDHFGYRDRLSEVPIEGTGRDPQPGSGPPVKAGELFLGYADESGAAPAGARARDP